MAVHHFFSMASFVALAVICRRAFAGWGILTAVLIGIPLLIIGLELAPKSIFRLYPFRLLRRLTFVLDALRTTAFIWRAPSRVLEAAMNSATPQTQLTHGGVAVLVENITSLHLLPAAATTLLERYAVFTKLTAADLATPWKSISAVPADLPLSSVLPLARQTGRRHQPVLGADGAVFGYLNAAALPPRLPPDRFVRQYTQPLPQLPASTPALRCLQSLRKSGAPMALVTNGVSGAAGIITLQSLLDRMLELSNRSSPSG
jgi:magnesium and cobalt exporter, CNNM family